MNSQRPQFFHRRRRVDQVNSPSLRTARRVAQTIAILTSVSLALLTACICVEQSTAWGAPGPQGALAAGPATLPDDVEVFIEPAHRGAGRTVAQDFVERGAGSERVEFWSVQS